MSNAYMPAALTDDWATPHALYEDLDMFHEFELDAAASSTNRLCEKWFGLDHPDEERRDGLTGKWEGPTWCNPPYGRGIKDWVAKASKHDDLVVMLLPARTDTIWFHEYCYGIANVELLRGRLKFGKAKTAAPFPSMIVKFNA
jgi:phage N-6-adenine-methyltransferase